jgi:DNA-binding XRE family transcriptional regulator
VVENNDPANVLFLRGIHLNPALQQFAEGAFGGAKGCWGKRRSSVLSFRVVNLETRVESDLARELAGGYRAEEFPAPAFDKHLCQTCRTRQVLWPRQETVARYIYFAMRKLPHNLRIERRQAGLSQADMAALFGVRSLAKLSRYENLRRFPSLTTALGYEAILGKPVAELFARE